MTQPVQDEQQMPEEDMTATEEAPASTSTDTPTDTLDEQAEPSTADLEAQLAQERERSGGYLEELQRERASFINFRRRTEQERESWNRDANAALIFNILPVLDDFERARDAVPEDQKDSPWVDGMLLIGRRLYSTLELAGLRQIEAAGKPFDPSLHEAVSVQPVEDQEAGIVLEELRKGYMLGDRVLRPSMVQVTG